MGSIFGTVLGTISQGFQNVIGLISVATMTMEGNVEGAKIAMGDLQRETDQAVGDLGNIFQIASDELDRFNELSEQSTAPQTMKNTGNNTQKTADEMERLRKATEEALKAQQELNRANDQMFETTSDLASQVDERLTSAYDKQLDSIKQLGGEINNQIAELDYQFSVLLDQADARKLNANEQERLNSLVDEISVLEGLAAEKRIAEQKEIITVNAENENHSQARFASLDKNIIEPLEKQWGFIKVEKIGRNRWISITEEGKNAAEFLI